MNVAIIVLLFCASESLAAPTSAPADQFYERATQELRSAVDAGSETTPRTISDFTVAIDLVRARPSEINRALLRSVMNEPNTAKPRMINEETWKFGIVLSLVEARAVLGEKDMALKILNTAENELKSNSNIRVPIISTDTMMSAVWADLGDYDKAVDLAERGAIFGDTVAGDTVLAMEFDAGGHPDLADRVLDRALKTALNRPADKRDFDVADVIGARMRRGDVTTATELAANMPATFRKTNVLRLLAEHDADAGDRDSAARELQAAIESVEQSDENKFDQYATLALAAAEMNQHDAARLSIARAVESAKTEEKTPPWAWGDLARAAAGVRSQQVGEFIDRCLKSAADLDAPEQANAQLYIAAAYATQGDFAKCSDAVEKSMSINRVDDYSRSNEYALVSRALVNAGQTKQALANAQALFKDQKELSRINENIARYELKEGNTDAAWDASKEANRWETRQLGLFVKVALREVKDGHSESAIAHIQSLADARDRAAVDLGVAEELADHANQSALSYFFR